MGYLYENLEKILTEKDLTYHKACILCGLPDDTVDNIIRKQKRDINNDTLNKLCSGLNVKRDDLLFYSNYDENKAYDDTDILQMWLNFTEDEKKFWYAMLLCEFDVKGFIWEGNKLVGYRYQTGNPINFPQIWKNLTRFKKVQWGIIFQFVNDLKYM